MIVDPVACVLERPLGLQYSAFLEADAGTPEASNVRLPRTVAQLLVLDSALSGDTDLAAIDLEVAFPVQAPKASTEVSIECFASIRHSRWSSWACEETLAFVHPGVEARAADIWWRSLLQ